MKLYSYDQLPLFCMKFSKLRTFLKTTKTGSKLLFNLLVHQKKKKIQKLSPSPENRRSSNKHL